MRGKYETLRTELESIYYADYIIDRLYKKIELKALNMSVEKWYEYIMKSVEKLCRFQVHGRSMPMPPIRDSLIRRTIMPFKTLQVK